MVSLRYYLKFKNEGWTDVGHLVQSSNTSPLSYNLCSTSWLATVNTANFTLKYTGTTLYQELVVKMIKAQADSEDVECRITDISGVNLFHGYVDLKKISIYSAKIPEAIKVSAVDVMDKLQTKIAENKVYAVGSSVKDVVNWLLFKTGLPQVLDSDWDGADREILEVPFVCTEEDSTTYLDAINKLLQEVGGYVLVSSPRHLGFVVRKVYDEEWPSDAETVHYLVSSKLKTDSSFFSNDGVVVSYPTVKESTKELVYMQNISISDGILKDPSADHDNNGDRIPSDKDGSKEIPLGEVVPVGGYYPLDSDVSKTFQEYDASLFDYAYQKKQRRTQNSDMGLFYVKPETIDVEFLATDKNGNEIKDWYENTSFYSNEGKFNYPEGGAFYPRKAWQIFHNKKNECINVQSFIIRGVAVYTDKVNKLVMPPECEDPYEYDASYVSSKEKAADLAWLLTNIKKHGGDTSSWTAPWDAYSLGQKVYIEHPSAVKVKALVVSKTLKVIGSQLWADYVAVHVDGFEASRQYVFSSSSNSAPVYDPYVQAVADGFSGTRNDFEVSNRMIVQYAVIPSSDDFGIGVEFGYGDSPLVYGFEADTAYGAGYTWTDGQIDQSTLLDGEYIWMRTSVDGGKTWRYTRLTGEVAKVFQLLADSYVYTINHRMSGNNPEIHLSTRISGYRGTAKIKCTTDSSYLDEETGVLIIPLDTTHDRVEVVGTLEGADDQVLTLNAIDITTYDMYFDKRTSLPSNALDGDYFVSESDFAVGGKTYTEGVSYVLSNGEWIPLTTSSKDYALKLSNVASTVLKDISITVPVTSALYGYFENIGANSIVSDKIFANDIQSSVYEEGVTGYKLSYIDGKINAVTGHFKDVQIDGTSEFHGDIYNDALTATNNVDITDSWEGTSEPTITRVADVKSSAGVSNPDVVYNRNITYDGDNYKYIAYIETPDSLLDSDEVTQLPVIDGEWYTYTIPPLEKPMIDEIGGEYWYLGTCVITVDIQDNYFPFHAGETLEIRCSSGLSITNSILDGTTYIEVDTTNGRPRDVSFDYLPSSTRPFYITLQEGDARPYYGKFRLSFPYRCKYEYRANEDIKFVTIPSFSFLVHNSSFRNRYGIDSAGLYVLSNEGYGKLISDTNDTVTVNDSPVPKTGRVWDSSRLIKVGAGVKPNGTVVAPTSCSVTIDDTTVEDVPSTISWNANGITFTYPERNQIYFNKNTVATAFGCSFSKTAKGSILEVQSIEPKNDTVDIGKEKPFDEVHAKNFYGELNGNASTVTEEWLLNTLYPVGTIYLTVSSNPLESSPASWLGGSWELLPADKALWTATSGAGGTIDAGLPNITGSIASAVGENRHGSSWQSGALMDGGEATWSQQNIGSTGGDVCHRYIKLDASRNGSDAIYGKTSTVQPPAYKVYAWKRTA